MSNDLYSQTNLIPNGSFERLNSEVFDKLNNSIDLYDSHFAVEDANLKMVYLIVVGTLLVKPVVVNKPFKVTHGQLPQIYL